MKMFEYGRRVIDEKRARPGDDLASKLLACEVDGRKLDDMEFLLFFLCWSTPAGHDAQPLCPAGCCA
jgi:cytochrome P450